MAKPITALPYYGGKSPLGKLGKWIASYLPDSYEYYAEPFAGMAGIMLLRRPSNCEIINDIDGRVTNWWTHIREHSEALAEKLTLTPRDENMWNEIKTVNWEEQTPLWQAWAFTVICTQTFSGKNDITSGYSRAYRKRAHWTRPYPDVMAERVLRLADRLANVQIYNVDALKFLAGTAPYPEAVIYVDPPYYSAIADYRHREYDVEALTEALKAQKGRVLLSGYPGEWDHLGWRHKDFVHQKTTSSAQGTSERTERIWANYEMRKSNSLF